MSEREYRCPDESACEWYRAYGRVTTVGHDEWHDWLDEDAHWLDEDAPARLAGFIGLMHTTYHADQDACVCRPARAALQQLAEQRDEGQRHLAELGRELARAEEALLAWWADPDNPPTYAAKLVRMAQENDR